jgi:hypothetical protein
VSFSFRHFLGETTIKHVVVCLIECFHRAILFRGAFYFRKYRFRPGEVVAKVRGLVFEEQRRVPRFFFGAVECLPLHSFDSLFFFQRELVVGSVRDGNVLQVEKFLQGFIDLLE